MQRLILLLMVCSLAHAENLYIAQSSAGSANGSSCANAFAVTFFNTAANWGGGTGEIDPGDTVHLCGTVTSKLLFQASGSSGNIITLVFETGAKMSAATWGTGATGEAIASQGNATIGYITIDGGSNGLIEATDNGSSPTYAHQDNTGAIYFPECNNCIIKNTIISNIYVKDTTDSQGGGDALHIQKGDNIQIYGMTVHDSQQCITVDANGGSNSDNVEIRNNTIYHCNWGIKVATNGTGATVTNLSIHDNDISDAVNWDDLDANELHHNGIILYTVDVSADIVSPLIYNNYIHGDFGVKETAHIFIDCEGGTITSPYIFNNVFTASNNTPPSGLVDLTYRLSGGCSPGTANIYNNTFYFASGVEGLGLQISQDTATVVKNNIFYRCSTCIYISGGSIGASDYNSFNGSIVNVINNGGTLYTTLAAWVSASSKDTHSISSAPNINASTFLPNSGSPVIAAGTNLSGLGITALNSDKAGVARGSSWDIGAYQFGDVSSVGSSISGKVTLGGKVVFK